MKTRLNAISFGLAMTAAIVQLVWPVYKGVGSEGVKHATLLQINGWWAIVPVMSPVLVTLVPLVVRRQAVRIVAAIIMGAFVLVVFSIGLFYLPASVLMLLAACVEDSAKSQDH